MARAQKRNQHKRAAKKSLFDGTSIETTHWSGSTRHELLLTFGIELEVFLVHDTQSYERDDFMRSVNNGILEETKRVEKELPKANQSWNLPKPALWLARDILRREGLEVAGIGTVELVHVDGMGWVQQPVGEGYTGWTLVEDETIGCDDPLADALRYIPERFDQEMLITGAGGGVELVSRKLSAPGSIDDGLHHPSLEEVGKYVAALGGKSTDSFGCFTNDTCGLHVHVGVGARKDPDKCGMFLLGVLQHLCYILLQYETTISQLFPPSRRGQDHKHSDWISSNLMGLRKTRHVCECYTDTFSEERLWKMEERIFAPNMTVDRLSDLMSELPRKDHRQGPSDTTRFKFINFKNLHSDSSRPPTLEFRQHESTVDPAAVKHWILFILALLRAAERKAKESAAFTIIASTSTPKCKKSNPQDLRTHPERQTQKYKPFISRRPLHRRITALLSLLSLPTSSHEYWLNRLDHFNQPSTPPSSPSSSHTTTTTSSSLPSFPPTSSTYWSSICPACHRDNILAARTDDEFCRELEEVRRARQVLRIIGEGCVVRARRRAGRMGGGEEEEEKEEEEEEEEKEMQQRRPEWDTREKVRRRRRKGGRLVRKLMMVGQGEVDVDF